MQKTNNTILAYHTPHTTHINDDYITMRAITRDHLNRHISLVGISLVGILWISCLFFVVPLVVVQVHVACVLIAVYNSSKAVMSKLPLTVIINMLESELERNWRLENLQKTSTSSETS